MKNVLKFYLLTSFLIINTQLLAQEQHAAKAKNELSLAEKRWLEAYHYNNVDLMDSMLQDQFMITLPNGEIKFKSDVINDLDEGSIEDGKIHYTTDRLIRVFGETAILTGIYVSLADDPGEKDEYYQYTDTWIFIDGRWRVVGSHLSGPVN